MMENAKMTTKAARLYLQEGQAQRRPLYFRRLEKVAAGS